MEAYGGKFFVTKDRSLKVSPLIGFAYTEPKNGRGLTPHASLLAGTRFVYTKGRNQVFSPATQVAIPLNGRTRLAAMTTIRDTVAVTKKLALAGEFSGKATRGSKPTGYVAAFALYQATPKVRIECGPTFNQARAWGFRCATFVALPKGWFR